MTFNKKQFALALGVFSAFFHALWVVAVALGVAQGLLDWTLSMHFIDTLQTVTVFSLGTALIGILKAFVCGYIAGWVLAWLLNKFSK